MTKPWKVITLTTDVGQEIRITSDQNGTGLELEYREADGVSEFGQPLYLSNDEIDHLITSLQQMKEYVNLK